MDVVARAVCFFTQIVAFSGSLRKASTNSGILRAAKSLGVAGIASFTIVPIVLPLFNEGAGGVHVAAGSCVVFFVCSVFFFCFGVATMGLLFDVTLNIVVTELYTSDSAPEEVLAFRKALRSADAYVLACPECALWVSVCLSVCCSRVAGRCQCRLMWPPLVDPTSPLTLCVSVCGCARCFVSGTVLRCLVCHACQTTTR